MPSSKKSFSDVQHLGSYHDCLPVIADLLTNLARQNDEKEAADPGAPSTFDGTKVPPVSTKDYLIRICKYGFCTPEVFVWIVVFLDRLNSRTGIEVTSINIHRLIISAFVLAAKLRDDTYYSNRYYASIGGISMQEMNKLEQAFLYHVDWNLWVDKEEYDVYVTNMRKRMERKREQLRKRDAERYREIVGLPASQLVHNNRQQQPSAIGTNSSNQRWHHHGDRCPEALQAPLHAAAGAGVPSGVVVHLGAGGLPVVLPHMQPKSPPAAIPACAAASPPAAIPVVTAQPPAPGCTAFAPPALPVAGPPPLACAAFVPLALAVGPTSAAGAAACVSPQPAPAAGAAAALAQCPPPGVGVVRVEILPDTDDCGTGHVN